MTKIDFAEAVAKGAPEYSWLITEIGNGFSANADTSNGFHLSIDWFPITAGSMSVRNVRGLRMATEWAMTGTGTGREAAESLPKLITAAIAAVLVEPF